MSVGFEDIQTFGNLIKKCFNGVVVLVVVCRNVLNRKQEAGKDNSICGNTFEAFVYKGESYWTKS